MVHKLVDPSELLLRCVPGVLFPCACDSFVAITFVVAFILVFVFFIQSVMHIATRRKIFGSIRVSALALNCPFLPSPAALGRG